MSHDRTSEYRRHAAGDLVHEAGHIPIPEPTLPYTKATRNTAGLRQHAREKKSDTQRRVDQAIHELAAHGEPVSFHRVAVAAHVSKSYLYTRREVRERIEALRQQDRGHPHADARRSVVDASVTENGKSVLLVAKQRRIETLEAENRRLKEELRIALGKLYAQA